MQIGDVVYLKSGGPPMTVVAVNVSPLRAISTVRI